MNEGSGKAFGPSLRDVLQRMDHGGRFARSKVSAVWPIVAGEAVSHHTTGAFLKDDGTLVVYVDTPTWATELTAMSEHFRTAVNAEMGEDLVSAIRFTVSRRVAKARAEDRAEEEVLKEAEVEPVPLTDEELQRVHEQAAVIGDADLREAAVRAAVKDLEWKKGLAARKDPERPSGRS